MHFPTSLPRSSGSPAFQLSANRGNESKQYLQANGFAGPIPSEMRRGSLPVLRRNSSQGFQNKNTAPISPAVPAYAHQSKARTSLPGSAEGGLSNSVQSKGPYLPYGLRNPSNDQTAAQVLWSEPSTIMTSTGAGVDGAGKFLRAPEKKAVKAFKTMKTPGFRKVFGKKSNRPSLDSYDSPTDAAELHAMKTRQKMAEQHSLEPDIGEGKAISPRAKLAARFARSRGHRDVETGLDLDRPDFHPFKGAKARLDEQRQRKMRRVSSGSKAQDEPSVDDSIVNSIHASQHGHRHVTELMHRKSNHGKVKETFDPNGSSNILEKNALEEDQMIDPTRMNSQRGDDYGQEPYPRSAGATQTSELNARHSLSPVSKPPENTLSVSANPITIDTKPSSVDSTPGYEYKQETQYFPHIPPSSEFQEPPYLGIADQPRTNHYSQLMFPPRPPAPFFRPTLSPVSSRSPVPTTVAHEPSTPPNAEKGRVGSPLKLSRKSQIYSPLQISSHSSRAGLPSTLAPAAPATGQARARNGAAVSIKPFVSVLPEPSAAYPYPAVELENKETNTPSTQTSIPSHVSSKPTQGKRLNTEITTRAVRDPGDRNAQPIQPNPSTEPAAPISDIQRPRSPPPQPSPSPIKIPARTPTASALEFWREADESLHPSDSASAQPPNYRGEPPPSFWKNADKALLPLKEAPTMEEWIASLPGLGLGLGPWGNSDGALDLKVFHTLRSTRNSRKLKKSRPGSKGSSTAHELIEQNIEIFEKAVEGAGKSVRSDGLTPDEAEALEDGNEEQAQEIAIGNQPPAVSDPNLLHPGYTPRSSTLSLPGTRDLKLHRTSIANAAPRGRLGKDVVSRLDQLERYWNEQSVAMGHVLKKMLVVVDTLIVKDREEAQKRARRVEMGWESSEEEEEDIIKGGIDAGKKKQAMDSDLGGSQ